MRVDVMWAACNFEPKYGVTMLTREEWTRGLGAPTAVKPLVWYTGRTKTRGEKGEMGGSLWTVFANKVHCLSRNIRYSFPGQDI
jgi:hypothetical protein